MPVTGRFSKQFYDRLGEQVTNELVDWLNLVDATYRGDLRELNELNFARFDAKVEQRFAESEARMERRFVALEGEFERRFVALEGEFERRFAALEGKFERRFVALESKFDKLADSKLDTAVFQHAIAQLEGRFIQSQANLERGLKEQTRFMFLAWSTLLIAIVGLSFRG